MTDKYFQNISLPTSGFDPQISGAGSNHSANCATTTAHESLFLCLWLKIQVLQSIDLCLNEPRVEMMTSGCLRTKQQAYERLVLDDFGHAARARVRGESALLLSKPLEMNERFYFY